MLGLMDRCWRFVVSEALRCCGARGKHKIAGMRRRLFDIMDEIFMNPRRFRGPGDDPNFSVCADWQAGGRVRMRVAEGRSIPDFE